MAVTDNTRISLLNVTPQGCFSHDLRTRSGIVMNDDVKLNLGSIACNNYRPDTKVSQNATAQLARSWYTSPTPTGTLRPEEMPHKNNSNKLEPFQKK